ncbi:MAG: hypothetical protein ACW98Y_10760 [Candidatus Thorarchaeota archaeon]|jgi:hypothetical protein
MISSFGSVALIEEVSADKFTIIDYDYEGIFPGTTQYFVLWNHASKTIDLQVNTTMLEFEGATGWPETELRVYEFGDQVYTTNYLDTAHTSDNYSCGINFDADGGERYVISVTNLDPVDDAVYNISIVCAEELDYQYTTMFEMDDVESPGDDTISITYFETANPYLYRLEGFSETRVIVEWTVIENDEYYWLIYNKGETCDLFIGLIGFSYYYDYPTLTALVNDFEDLDAGKEDSEELILFNILNTTCGGSFTCEADHRYRFWLDVGVYGLQTYVIFDTFGETQLDYDADILTENPDDVISLRPSVTDPWLEFRQLNRDIWMWWLGIGGAGAAGIGFTVWFLRKRYY